MCSSLIPLALPIPALAESMVGLDESFERLLRCAKTGWTKPAEHPDLDPAHEVLKTREILVEILRSEDCRTRPEDFRQWMEGARAAAERLEALLRAPTISREPTDQALAALKKTCADCHKPYRNVRTRK